MKTIDYYDMRPLVTLGSSASRHQATWSFPQEARRVDLLLPTDRIRLLASATQGETECGTIVAIGEGRCLFRPDAGSALAARFGVDQVCHVEAGNYMLALEPTCVQPADAWLERWLTASWGEPELARRRDLLGTKGLRLEVRDTHHHRNFEGEPYADLHAFFVGGTMRDGQVVHNEGIAMPHQISTLRVVSGPDPARRFSLGDALDGAREQCRQLRRRVLTAVAPGAHRR